MDLQACTDALRAKAAQSGFDASLKFDCGDDGVVVVDRAEVDNRDRDTECTVAISLAGLGALLARELDPVTGFMSGRLKVSGDMGVALKLQKLLV
jgi:putative sterol carrier protein